MKTRVRIGQHAGQIVLLRVEQQSNHRWLAISPDGKHQSVADSPEEAVDQAVGSW